MQEDMIEKEKNPGRNWIYLPSNHELERLDCYYLVLFVD